MTRKDKLLLIGFVGLIVSIPLFIIARNVCISATGDAKALYGVLSIAIIIKTLSHITDWVVERIAGKKEEK